ncbi:hypothetical protein F5148DRAFT_222472 [Russula earlei]|uniref:Uncharacterized protein n=1 Tax=Russula earlei TaxID=71964 RepID=A0ACC0U429_9AGAM|nr:hypothetical protein F5148DRAFT_222472 [Russula earlei]
MGVSRASCVFALSPFSPLSLSPLSSFFLSFFGVLSFSLTSPLPAWSGRVIMFLKPRKKLFSSSRIGVARQRRIPHPCALPSSAVSSAVSTTPRQRSPTYWHPFPCSGDHDDSAVDMTTSRWPRPPPIHASSRARGVPLPSPLLRLTHAAKRGLL